MPPQVSKLVAVHTAGAFRFLWSVWLDLNQRSLLEDLFPRQVGYQTTRHTDAWLRGVVMMEGLR